VAESRVTLGIGSKDFTGTDGSLLVSSRALALTISGIGIMNTCSVTFTERTRGDCISQSVGAPRDAILYHLFCDPSVPDQAHGSVLIGIVIAVSHSSGNQSGFARNRP